MKLLTLLPLFFFTFNLFAADTVRINNASSLVVTGITNTSFTLSSDSTDGTTETAPAKFYMPIKSGVAGQLNFSTLVKSGVTELFDITSTSHSVSIPLLTTVGATSKYLYLAVRGGASGTSYYVSGRTTDKQTSGTTLVNFSFKPLDICKSVILNNISTVCNTTTGALYPTSVTSVVYKPLLYFFITDQVIAVDGSTVIDPGNDNYSGGVYFESQMSNRFFDSSALVVSLSSLMKGDSRLIGTFSASTTMDTSIFQKVIVYQYDETSTPITTNLSVGAASAGSILNKDISTNQSGDFTLSGLTNGRDYKISVAFKDKFLFATTLSNSMAERPLEIQELLKKQACYLLTAGFGEEHYVTNFFRIYRDHILAHTWIGKKFIKAYYKTAPHYAMIIYQYKGLRASIRGAAYILYFFFNYSWLMVLLFSSCYFLNIWKNKFLLENNSL